jgi:hypothetical protein
VHSPRAARPVAHAPCRDTCHGRESATALKLGGRRPFHRPRLCQAKVHEALTCEFLRLFAPSRRQQRCSAGPEDLTRRARGTRSTGANELISPTTSAATASSTTSSPCRGACQWRESATALKPRPAGAFSTVRDPVKPRLTKP